ncbi:sigma-70 family RNA polymerase sigma factor [Brevibacillus sp. TJ4]|uniref:sigma-70 family RNA polymerase sigma factor n=1 Tax=Brevibacillus sp. TJ4 TaxID=3234853 RepID=UPI0037D72104
MNDQDLLPLTEQMAKGDVSAFRKVYEMTHKDVYRTVAFLVYNRQDIEDIVHEVYIRMWQSFHSYDRKRPFRHWLHGIAIRQVQDWKRKAWRRMRIFERATQYRQDDSDWTDDAVLQSETQRELLTAIRQLSYKLRVVVILRYFHDYSLEEIADLLNIPVGTVKSRHHLAVKELRKNYTHSGGDLYVPRQTTTR